MLHDDGDIDDEELLLLMPICMLAYRTLRMIVLIYLVYEKMNVR